MVRKIAFINGKGGCGKTMSIFSIAGVLSKRGDKVLVIDLDKQRNTSKRLLMNNDELPVKTVLDFMKGEAEASEVTAPALFQTRGNSKAKYFGVDCMVSDVRLQDESELAGDTNKSLAARFLECVFTSYPKIKDWWLKFQVEHGGVAGIDGISVGERLNKFIEEQGYDWVLVDMPPSNLTLNNICFQYIVDYTIIPFSSDMDSVDGYADIMHIMEEARKVNPTLNVLGVYLSDYTSNCGLDNFIREQLLEFDTFIDVQIPHATDLRETALFGRPISYYKTFSKSRKAFEDLVDEMERRMNK